MKRAVVLWSLLSVGANFVYAQADVKAWTRMAGTSGYDECYAVAADSAGNCIVAGGTDGSLGGGNAGRYDMFVGKFDGSGNLSWMRQRGTAQREFAYGVTTDASGNIYATGYTGAALDGQAYVGNWDVFLMKFNSAGTWLWTRQIGTGQDDEGYAVTTDAAGNVYMTGYVRGDLHGQIRVGSADVFICKYDASGTRLWTRLFGSLEIDQAWGIATDASGNVFVTGYATGSIDGYPYLANGDIFLAKYDTNGNKLWVREWGTWNAEHGYSLTTDAAGNVYLSGYTTGSLYGSTSGGRDVIIAKFDGSGNPLWGRQFGSTPGVGTNEHDQGWGVRMALDGNIYLAGAVEGPFDGNVHQGGLDVFLAKYDPAGNRLWSLQYGSAANDSARGVATNSSGVVFLAGQTTGNLDGNANVGLIDVFASKFVPISIAPPQITAHPQSQSTCLGSTVQFSVTAQGAAPLSYQWQKNSANLSNGGHYSGVTTATLTISNADGSDAANYRCIVTNGYGNATSNQASLTVSSSPPATPVDTAPLLIAPDIITWGWIDVANEFGYRVKDFSGAVKSGDLPANTTQWQESGLTANTLYSRRVVAFNGCGVSADSAGQSRYTLPLPPAYGTGTTSPAILCDKGESHPYVGANTSVTFTAPNGFGPGPSRVGMFGYLWDQNPGNPASWAGEQFWTSGALVKQTGTSGNWYLHVRSYNADSPAAVNATVLNLGPYTVSASPCLQNVGFENGFTGGAGNGWTKFIIAGAEGPDLAFSAETTEKRSGLYSQEIYSHDIGQDGGVYQQFAAEPGQTYTVSAWFKVYSPQGTGIAEGILGVDPTGGTNPLSASVWWGGKVDNFWSQKSYTFTALADRITVYLRGRSTKAASLNKVAYIWVDDVLPTCAAPAAPADGTPIALSTTAIRWTWTDVTFDVGYRVKDAGGVQKSPDLPANSTQWDETTGLSANTSYTRRVSAFNDYGESPLSTGQSCYTLIETPLGVSIGAVTETSIEAAPDGAFSNLAAGSSGVRTSNTTAGTNSGWMTNTSAWISSGLAPNTPYAFVARAKNAVGVETPDSPPATVWTLSVAPAAGSVVPDDASPAVNQPVSWTATAGFGAGTVQYYRVAWDQSATHDWTGTETVWSTGSLLTTPSSSGTWYLHVQGYNGEDVANGSYSYAVTTAAGVPADLDGDGDVDGTDYGIFAGCFNGSGNTATGGCLSADLDGDNDVDGTDYGIFSGCFNGSGNSPACSS